MNFLVVGPGAMGCLFASRFKKTGHNVTLLDYRPERADFINEHGVTVKEIAGNFRIHVPTVITIPIETPDVILICVKAYQTRKAAENLQSCLGPNTVVLTLQNGLANLEILQDIFGRDRVLGGVTAEGATLLAKGHVRHAGQGETLIGAQGLPLSTAAEIVSAFNAAGFKARPVKNVNDLIWGKLVINAGINALTAITRLKNGRLPEIQGTKTVMEEAVREAVAVAHAKGITLPYPDPLERVLEVCSSTTGNIASMLQDVVRQQITEVGFINGAIVREGGILGIPTPVNMTLTCLVQALQETYHERISKI